MGVICDTPYGPVISEYADPRIDSHSGDSDVQLPISDNPLDEVVDGQTLAIRTIATIKRRDYAQLKCDKYRAYRVNTG